MRTILCSLPTAMGGRCYLLGMNLFYGILNAISSVLATQPLANATDSEILQINKLVSLSDTLAAVKLNRSIHDTVLN